MMLSNPQTNLNAAIEKLPRYDINNLIDSTLPPGGFHDRCTTDRTRISGFNDRPASRRQAADRPQQATHAHFGRVRGLLRLQQQSEAGQPLPDLQRRARQAGLTAHSRWHSETSFSECHQSF